MTDFKEFPEYDEVHVISDIHMGGKPGFQILRETKRLAGYIGWVAGQAPEGKVALVLNGDVFDTLAEDIKGYVAIDDAVTTVRRIMEDKSFIAIWDALAEFVARDRRTLIFVIGNHDIEMAFPTVQSLIIWKLAGDDLLKRARIVFSTTGAGYTCTVGDARIYCTHGNEVDGWNYNRYEDLAKISRHLNAGRSLDPKEWHPNAGTRMVKEVMNEVKGKYKWIDLLKPEATAAAGTLFVLDPSKAFQITKLASIAGEKIRGDKQVDQRLSAEGFQTREQAGTAPVKIDELLGPNLTYGIRVQQNKPSESIDAMLLEAERNLGQPAAILATPDEVLGWPQLIWDRFTNWITGMDEDEALRRALQDWLEGDKTFNIKHEDDTYKHVMAAVDPSIDFIVTGHTHLERAIKTDDHPPYYFNCGTWIRLLQFPDAKMKDQESFKQVYEVLKDGRMEAIDEAVFDGQSFVMNQTSAVSIKKEGGKVVGQLTHIEGDGKGQSTIMAKFERG